MNTFTINFTDLIGNFWTMNWEPGTARNKNLKEKDIQDVVQFIKTGSWPKGATAAAKNCYDTLATQIATTIVEDTSSSYERTHALVWKIARLYADYKFSKNGDALYNQIEELSEEEKSEEKTVKMKRLLRKIIKSERIFAVKFEEDENWLVDVMTKMKCCICGETLYDDRQGHNPYPVRPQSWYGEKENRCCSSCNQRVVIPARIRCGRKEIYHRTMMKMDYEELLEFVS